MEINEIWFYIEDEDHEYNANVLAEEIGEAHQRDYDKALKRAKKGFLKFNKAKLFSKATAIMRTNISYTCEKIKDNFIIYPVFFTTTAPEIIPNLINSWNRFVAPTLKKKYKKYFARIEIKKVDFDENRHIVDVIY